MIFCKTHICKALLWSTPQVGRILYFQRIKEVLFLRRTSEDQSGFSCWFAEEKIFKRRMINMIFINLLYFGGWKESSIEEYKESRTNDFTEWTILLNKWFYWTIVQWENYRNRWKMNDNFENERNQFFWMVEKKTKWDV